MPISVNGKRVEIERGERLIDVLNRSNTALPQVCYHPQLGAIQTCDTCMVEVDGKLTRACGALASDGMSVVTSTQRVDAAQREAFDRILGNHLLYCTVCDNNNGNCTVHNTTGLLGVEHQEIPFQPKPYKSICPIPFIATIPTNAFFAGAASRPARTCK